jgi:hypothetical protein
MKTLPREPYRGGQICGEQMEYGVVMGRSVFCGERKAHMTYLCPEHTWENIRCGDPEPKIAPGNALGDVRLPVELQWEGNDGEYVSATPEEVHAWLTSGADVTSEGG